MIEMRQKTAGEPNLERGQCWDTTPHRITETRCALRFIVRYGRLRVRVGPLFENRFDPGTSSRLNSVLNDDSGSVLVPGSNCVPENEKKVVPRQLPRLCWGTVWLFTSLLVAFLRESKFSLFTPLCNFYFCAERARRRAADRHVCRWEPPRRSTAAPLGPVGPSESTLR